MQSQLLITVNKTGKQAYQRSPHAVQVVEVPLVLIGRCQLQNANYFVNLVRHASAQVVSVLDRLVCDLGFGSQLNEDLHAADENRCQGFHRVQASDDDLAVKRMR